MIDNLFSNQDHVAEQAKEQNLNEAQTALLLAETLEYNGLPLINSNPDRIGLLQPSQSESFLPSLQSLIGGLSELVSPGPGFNTVNRQGEPADTGDTDEASSGLPTPGTLEHTVTLGLFRLSQGINQLAVKLSQPESLLTEVGQYGYSLISGENKNLFEGNCPLTLLLMIRSTCS